jgi:hypothetical protein
MQSLVLYCIVLYSALGLINLCIDQDQLTTPLCGTLVRIEITGLRKYLVTGGADGFYPVWVIFCLLSLLEFEFEFEFI